MRDSQRLKVYNWETNIEHKFLPPFVREEMTLEECKILSDKAHIRYSYFHNLPVIKSVNRNHPDYRSWENSINLPTFFRNSQVVLHEAAHSIVEHIGCEEPDHGKMFVKVYINLLSYFFKVKTSDLRKDARKRRIKIDWSTNGHLPKMKKIKARAKRLGFIMTNFRKIENISNI